MKIYIATPVNARKEATLEEKRLRAYHRVSHIKVALKKIYPDAEFHSSFDDWIAPLRGGNVWKESSIMGGCVQCVMECDAIFLDGGWMKSKGCRVEYQVANIYGKQIIKL